MFWKKNEKELVGEMPAFVVKLKQDRYGMWICGETRISADSIEELEERMTQVAELVVRKCASLND
jgi:hypothetical protein